MSYEAIDPIINVWCKDMNLNLVKNYKDFEVRSVIVYAKNGDRYQLWIEDMGTEKYAVKGWDFKKKHVEIVSELSNLCTALNKVYDEILNWISLKDSKT